MLSARKSKVSVSSVHDPSWKVFTIPGGFPGGARAARIARYCTLYTPAVPRAPLPSLHFRGYSQQIILVCQITGSSEKAYSNSQQQQLQPRAQRLPCPTSWWKIAWNKRTQARVGGHEPPPPVLLYPTATATEISPPPPTVQQPIRRADSRHPCRHEQSLRPDVVRRRSRPGTRGGVDRRHGLRLPAVRRCTMVVSSTAANAANTAPPPLLPRVLPLYAVGEPLPHPIMSAWPTRTACHPGSRARGGASSSSASGTSRVPAPTLPGAASPAAAGKVRLRAGHAHGGGRGPAPRATRRAPAPAPRARASTTVFHRLVPPCRCVLAVSSLRARCAHSARRFDPAWGPGRYG